MSVDLNDIVMTGDMRGDGEIRDYTLGDLMVYEVQLLASIALALRGLVELYKVTPVMRIQPPEPVSIVAPGRIRVK